MAKPKNLYMGVDSKSPTPQEKADRLEELSLTVARYLPEFVRMVEETKTLKVDQILIHQDAFAAGYHDDEYTLFGMALKYAGRHGLNVMIVA